MFSFCPHCGGAIEQEQIEGRMLVCVHCAKPIGLVKKDESEAPPVRETNPRCPVCQQLVDVRMSGTAKKFVPHYRAGERKICLGSGKPV